MAVNTVARFESFLTAPMTASDTQIALPAEITNLLNTQLGVNDHTYLNISDALGIETVKYGKVNGLVYVTRGQDKTVARAWPKGACVENFPTSALMRDMICLLCDNCNC